MVICDERVAAQPRGWFAIPGAYAVSRLDFFGRRHVSAMFLMVYLFPAIVVAIPLFVHSLPWWRPGSSCS